MVATGAKDNMRKRGAPIRGEFPDPLVNIRRKIRGIRSEEGQRVHFDPHPSKVKACRIALPRCRCRLVAKLDIAALKAYSLLHLLVLVR